MNRWAQFVAIATAQLSGRSSLGDVVSNIAAQARKLYYLCIRCVSRSPLSRVNESQPYELYEALLIKLPCYSHESLWDSSEIYYLWLLKSLIDGI